MRATGQKRLETRMDTACRLFTLFARHKQLAVHFIIRACFPTVLICLKRQIGRQRARYLLQRCGAALCHVLHLCVVDFAYAEVARLRVAEVKAAYA